MKTYESDLGYSVSYPSSWVVSADDTIAPASPEIDNDMLTVYFRARVENAAFRDVSANLRKTFAGSSNIEMNITFGGEKAYGYQEQHSQNSYSVLVEHNNKVYYIWTQRYESPEVREIFSSFKFTENANWKTYWDEEHGFKFQYPENWNEDQGDSEDSILVYDPTYSNINFMIEIKSLSDEQEILRHFDNKFEAAIVAGISAKRLSNVPTKGEGDREEVIFSKDGQLFEISWYGADSSIIEQMLSTFKFN